MGYDLTQHEGDSSGVKYLSTGMYDGGITEVRTFQANNGTRGMNVDFMKGGMIAVGTYWWTDKATKFILSLGKACGLTPEQLANFDEEGSMLVGRPVSFAVIPSDDESDRHEVRYTWPTGEQAPDRVRENMDGYMAPPPGEQSHVPPDDDDVPF